MKEFTEILNRINVDRSESPSISQGCRACVSLLSGDLKGINVKHVAYCLVQYLLMTFIKLVSNATVVLVFAFFFFCCI